MGMKMKGYVIAAAFAASAAFMVSCGGGGGGGKGKFDPSDSLHVVSYAIGYDAGKRIRDLNANLETKLDLKVVLLAVREAAEGLPGQITDSAVAVINGQVREEIRNRAIEQRRQLEISNHEAAMEFLEKNKSAEGVVTTESGLQYVVIAKGEGPKPKLTDFVRVHYVGAFPDGTVFENTVVRGEPAVFRVDDAMRIRGLTEALQLMGVGSKYKIFVPPALGYARRGASVPLVGPNMVLIFELELLDIEK